MRKLLLTFLCLFGFIAVWAQDGSFSATFKRGSDNNQPAYTTSTALSDVFSEGANYFSAIKATSNCSPGTGGIKIGPNKNAGNITFALSAAGQKKSHRLLSMVAARRMPRKSLMSQSMM